MIDISAFNGFKELEEELKSYISKSEKPLQILEIGAKEFVKDLSKLPSPISKIKKSGYTHLIDTFTYNVTKNDVEVGWGKWYGRAIETGANIHIKNSNKTVFVRRTHLAPVYEKNKDKYYKLMIKDFYR